MTFPRLISGVVIGTNIWCKHDTIVFGNNILIVWGTCVDSTHNIVIPD